MEYVCLNIGVNDKVSEGLKVHVRALCCKARGGGGRLRHAAERVKKEKKQEEEVYYKSYI